MECPIDSGCITITENLEFLVYLDHIKIEMNRFPIKEKILSSISTLEVVPNFVENNGLVPKESIMDAIIRLFKSHEDYDESKS